MPPPTPQRSGVVSLKPGIVSVPPVHQQHPFLQPKPNNLKIALFLHFSNLYSSFYSSETSWVMFFLLFFPKPPRQGALVLHAIDLPRHVAVPALTTTGGVGFFATKQDGDSKRKRLFMHYTVTSMILQQDCQPKHEKRMCSKTLAISEKSEANLGILFLKKWDLNPQSLKTP